MLKMMKLLGSDNFIKLEVRNMKLE